MGERVYLKVVTVSTIVFPMDCCFWRGYPGLVCFSVDLLFGFLFG